jgi:hypothetical protein
MISPDAFTVNDLMAEYASAVRELKLHAAHPENTGKFEAGRPFFVRTAVSAYLDLSDLLPETKDADTRKYNQITAELDTLMAMPDASCQKILRQELGTYVTEYEAELCASSAGMELPEEDLSVREKIQILAEALTEYPAFGELLQKIAYLDTLARNCVGNSSKKSKKTTQESPVTGKTGKKERTDSLS